MTSLPQTKCCSKCGEEKPLSEFYPRKGRRDGRRSACKECVKEASRQWRQEHPEKKTEYNRRYKRENREEIKAYSQRYNRRLHQEEPERLVAYRVQSAINTDDDDLRKRYAREAVALAVRAGMLPPIHECECADCGKQAEHYHHEDYRRALKVEALCISCHVARHDGSFNP